MKSLYSYCVKIISKHKARRDVIDKIRIYKFCVDISINSKTRKHITYSKKVVLGKKATPPVDALALRYVGMKYKREVLFYTREESDDTFYTKTFIPIRNE